MADRILATVNVDWVLFRVVDANNSQTISEHSKYRENAKMDICNIGNKELINNKFNNNYAVLRSTQENLHLKTFCILSRNNLDKNQKIFINKLVDDLGMIYLIFTSMYYNESRIK